MINLYSFAAFMRSMSTLTGLPDFAFGDPNMRLMPWYVTGIVDGEGSFGITITSSGTGSSKIRFEFKVTQKRSNAGILYDLQRFFGVGSVVIDNRSDDTMKYVVTSRDALINVIMSHFTNYSLVTSKQLNFADFKEALLIVSGALEVYGDLVDHVKTLKQGMNKERLFADKFKG